MKDILYNQQGSEFMKNRVRKLALYFINAASSLNKKLNSACLYLPMEKGMMQTLPKFSVVQVLVGRARIKA
jgi:hypothetical protein